MYSLGLIVCKIHHLSPVSEFFVFVEVGVRTLAQPPHGLSNSELLREVIKHKLALGRFEPDLAAHRIMPEHEPFLIGKAPEQVVAYIAVGIYYADDLGKMGFV